MTLTDFLKLVSSELEIRVEFFDSGGHRDDAAIDDIAWDDDCWNKEIKSVQIDASKVYVQLVEVN